MQAAAHDNDIVYGTTVDSRGTTDYDDRLVRRFPFGKCVAAKEAKMDAVAPEALSELLHPLATRVAPLLAPLRHPLAVLLTGFLNALTLLLPGLVAIPAKIIVWSSIGLLRPGN
jgi:hypothetical protein